MSLGSKLRRLLACAGSVVTEPRASARTLAALPETVRGSRAARNWGNQAAAHPPPAGAFAHGEDAATNPLLRYFQAIHSGAGVWKWLHYFEIYHRHLQRWIGQPVTLAEVGVYSGGSMPMWRDYFGAQCHVHGIDIQPECHAYANDHTTIHIGDQADPDFWQQFRAVVPQVDVLIDDGGHQPEQQMVTLEEMLPALRPGGVYLCEDVHGINNRFSAFALALTNQLNAFAWTQEAELRSSATPFQAAVHSVHFYPFVVVIEKRATALQTFAAPKHGTEWQPFL